MKQLSLFARVIVTYLIVMQNAVCEGRGAGTRADLTELFVQHPVHFNVGLQKQLSSRSSQQEPHLRWFEVQLWEFTCGAYDICSLQRKVADCSLNSLGFVEYENSIEAGDLVIENYVPSECVLRLRFREKPLGEEWVAAYFVLQEGRYIKEVKAEVTEWGRIDPKKQLGTYEFISDHGTLERTIPCKVSWPGTVGK